MFILHPSAGLDFIQSPAAIREAFESINSNEHAARPQQPRLDADLDPHALDCAGERFLCWFGIINGLPEPLRALTAPHIAGLRQEISFPVQVPEMVDLAVFI